MSAVDIEGPDRDVASGAGLINAHAALDTLANEAAAVITIINSILLDD